MKETNIHTNQEVIYDKATYQDYKHWLEQIGKSGFLAQQETRGIYYELISK